MKRPFNIFPGIHGKTKAFVLLEVMLSIVILGVAIAALMRSFTVSIAATRKAQIITTATLLAQQILEEYEVAPPQEDHMEGVFGSSEDDYEYDEKALLDKETRQYKSYSWVVDVEEVEVEYEDIAFEGGRDELENLTMITVNIIYNDGRLKRFTPVKVQTYLTNAEKFTYSSKKENQLY